MTRAQAAQMFYNLLLDKDVAITVSFSDVAENAWYAEAVNTLASLGIVDGVGGRLFAPERAITRAEFTVIAMRFAHLDTGGENIFSDVSRSDWFYDQVVGSVKYGWINGLCGRHLPPEQHHNPRRGDDHRETVCSAAAPTGSMWTPTSGR